MLNIRGKIVKKNPEASEIVQAQDARQKFQQLKRMEEENNSNNQVSHAIQECQHILLSTRRAYRFEFT